MNLQPRELSFKNGNRYEGAEKVVGFVKVRYKKPFGGFTEIKTIEIICPILQEFQTLGGFHF